MEEFNIITTATLRPELLKRTFDSFIKNLFRDQIENATLVINIDKVGCPPEKVSGKLREIFEYIGEIPFHDIYINCPIEPSFSKAFCWVLGVIDKPLTFNLEEDWELLYPVNFEKMVDEFKDQDLAHLRLSAFPALDDKELKTWNKFCPWNGCYFEVPRNLRGTIGWAGHPSLNRTSFLMFFKTILDSSKNPEKQIKGAYPIIMNSRFGVFQKQRCLATIKDIGRPWMAEHGWKKQGNKAFFTQWEKTNE